MVEVVIKEITGISGATIAKLVVIKTQLSEDVKAAIDEVEKTLAQPQLRLRTKYGPVLRALVEKGSVIA